MARKPIVFTVNVLHSFLCHQLTVDEGSRVSLRATSYPPARLTARAAPTYHAASRRRPPAAQTSTREETMAKELSILAHDTVDQPPPATGI